MNRKNRHKVKLVFAWLVLLAIVTSTYSRNYYLHAHKLVNGAVISHSHPYQKNSDSTPFKSHHHNHDQLANIDQNDCLFFSANASHEGSLQCIELRRTITQQICRSGQIHEVPGRAPPTTETCHPSTLI